MTKDQIIKAIDPNRIYKPMDILRLGLIPWITAKSTLHYVIANDMKGDNLLQTTVIKKGTIRGYLITGANLRKFINKHVEERS